jgi:LEA14-like dessication related protein
MHFSRFIFLCLLILIGLTGSGCLTMKSVSIRSLEDLRLEMDAGTPTLRFGLRVENSNNWGVRLLEAETGLLLDNQTVGQAKASERMKIRRHSETLVPVTIRTSYSDLLRLLPQGLDLLSGNRAVEGRARGSLKVGKFIFSKRIAFDYGERIDEQKLKKLFAK